MLQSSMPKATIIPTTRLGKWSFWLITAFLWLFLLLRLLIVSGQRGGETFFDNLLLSIPGALAGLCAVVAFFTGIIAIVKHKERSILVFISSTVGLLVLIFVSGEFLFPH